MTIGRGLQALLDEVDAEASAYERREVAYCEAVEKAAREGREATFLELVLAVKAQSE